MKALSGLCLGKSSFHSTRFTHVQRSCLLVLPTCGDAQRCDRLTAQQACCDSIATLFVSPV